MDLISEQEAIVERVYNFVMGRTDRLTFEDSIAWLEQMELERPTQVDLGKDTNGNLIPFQND